MSRLKLIEMVKQGISKFPTNQLWCVDVEERTDSFHVYLTGPQDSEGLSNVTDVCINKSDQPEEAIEFLIERALQKESNQ